MDPLHLAMTFSIHTPRIVSRSTAVLQGPLNLTVSSHRTLSREIHFADHRSKPGIYRGCLGEVHLYNSFTIICDLLASNST